MLTETEVELAVWLEHNQPEHKLLYRDGFWRQVNLIRNDVAGLLADKSDHIYGEYTSLIRVINYHRSKSVKLPVYSINWKRGIRFILRNNFYDWKITCLAKSPLGINFRDLFDPSEKFDSCYCEGFPEELVKGCYKDNEQEFTTSLSDDYSLMTFLWLIKSTTQPVKG